MALAAWVFLSFWNGLNLIGGREPFFLLGFLMMSVIFLVSPLLGSSAITVEKERDTWDLLCSTPFQVNSILFGKFASSLLFLWLILISIIPILSLLLPFGGVSPQEVTVIILLETEAMIIGTLIGLACSLYFRRTIQAVCVAYILTFAFFTYSILIDIFRLDSLNWSLFIYYMLPSYPIQLLSPLYMLMVLYRPRPGTSLESNLLMVSIGMALLGGMCFWLLHPILKEKIQDFLERSTQRIARGLENRRGVYLFLFLVYLSTLFLFFLQYFLTRPYFRGFPILWLIVLISPAVIIYFPFVYNLRYRRLWSEQPWREVESTPKHLRQFLFRQIGTAFHDFGLLLLCISPLFLLLTYPDSSRFQQTLLLLIFSLFVIVLISTTYSLYESLRRDSFHKSLFFTYLWSLVFLSFDPIHLLPRLKQYYHPLLLFLNPPYFDLYAILFYSIYIIVLFVILILLAQRLVLQKAGVFRRENIIQWFKRTIMNLVPQKGKSAKIQPPLPDGWNPILIKEIRELILRPFTGKVAVTLFLAGLLLAGSTEQDRIFFVAVIFLLPLLIVPLATNTFRREHDQDTWDVLYTTTLKPTQILQGKFLSTLSLAAIYLILFLLPVGLIRADFIEKQDFYINFCLILFFYGLLLSTISVYVSSLFRRTVMAYLFSLTAAYCLLFLFGQASSPFILLNSLLFHEFAKAWHAWFNQVTWEQLRNAMIISYLLFAVMFYALTYFRIRDYTNRS